jgi:hypothetical protein
MTLYDESGAVDCHEDVYFAGDADAEHGYKSRPAQDELYAPERFMEALLSTLTPKQRFVVECRWGLRGHGAHSQAEIAALMGIAQQAVVHIYRRALKRLRKGVVEMSLVGEGLGTSTYDRQREGLKGDNHQNHRQAPGWKQEWAGGAWTLRYVGIEPKPWYPAPPCEPLEGTYWDDRLVGEEHVYLAHAPKMGLVKIGTSRNVRGRLAALRQASPAWIELAREIPGGFALERELHERFKDRRKHGEWFDDSILDELDDVLEDLEDEFGD